MVARKDGLPKKPKRPEVYYTPEIASYICENMAMGRSLKNICENDEGMPSVQTALRWQRMHQDFHAQVLAAREAGADAFFEQIETDMQRLDEMVENGTADHAAVTALRARIHTNQWRAAVLKPRNYSEKARANIIARRSLADLSPDDLQAEIDQIDQTIAIEGQFKVLPSPDSETTP